jgi:hypothetical protein
MVGMKILWYNKSRAKSRICPACLRLYNIGDELNSLTSEEDLTGKVALSARLLREQEMSGFCGSILLLIEKGNCNKYRFAGVLRYHLC